MIGGSVGLYEKLKAVSGGGRVRSRHWAGQGVDEWVEDLIVGRLYCPKWILYRT